MENLASLIAECKEALDQPCPITILKCQECGTEVELKRPERFKGRCRKCQSRKLSEDRHGFHWTSRSRNTYQSKQGKCRLCGKKFRLRNWQHSILHWCPMCRKGETYKEFASNNGYRNHFSSGGTKYGYRRNAIGFLEIGQLN